jgi:hypothetical protein
MNEDSGFLGHDAVSIGKYLPKFRGILLPPAIGAANPFETSVDLPIDTMPSLKN